MFEWFKKRRAMRGSRTPHREASLASVPVRNRLVQWEETEDGVLLHVPVQQMGRRRPLASLFRMPDTRDIALDWMGSEIWRQCDGQRATAELLEWMRWRWQFSHKEAEQGLTAYLRKLAERGLIAFVSSEQPEKPSAGADEPPDRAGPS